MIAEHDNSNVSAGTRSAITAASQISAGNVTVLVPGAGIDGVAADAAKINGVTKVLTANNDVSWLSTTLLVYALLLNYFNISSVYV